MTAMDQFNRMVAFDLIPLFIQEHRDTAKWYREDPVGKWLGGELSAKIEEAEASYWEDRLAVLREEGE